MIVSKKEEKRIAFKILERSFQNNPSVLNSLKQDKHIEKRIRVLLRYLVNLAYRNAGLYLSDCRDGAAIAMRYDTLRQGIGGYWDQLMLALFGTGLRKVPGLLKKEALLKEIRPTHRKYFYCWLMAVNPEKRGGAIFLKLSKEIAEQAKLHSMDLYYETSVERNVRLYRALGAELYKEVSLDEESTLYCFRQQLRAQ